MKILVVGAGGREHAIIKKLKENPEAPETAALQKTRNALTSVPRI